MTFVAIGALRVKPLNPRIILTSFVDFGICADSSLSLHFCVVYVNAFSINHMAKVFHSLLKGVTLAWLQFEITLLKVLKDSLQMFKLLLKAWSRSISKMKQVLCITQTKSCCIHRNHLQAHMEGLFSLIAQIECTSESLLQKQTLWTLSRLSAPKSPHCLK